MSRIIKLKNIILTSAAVMVVTAAFLLFYQKGAFLSNTINWQEGNLAFAEGRVIYGNRTAAIYYKGGEVWHSPWNVNVQQCAVFDIDRDGSEELLMLVWKRGSYGRQKPFFVKRNDNELAQHIFIYKWEPSRTYKLRAIWMSSAISDSINSLEIGVDGRVYITDNDKTVDAWYWKNFGLKQLAQNCEKVSFIALGDQLLHLPVLKRGLKSGDFSYMYENIADEVRSHDIACLNQETVYVKDYGLISDYPRFASPDKVADAVKFSGFNVACLANNHALDQQMYGIDCSVDVNRQKGIITLGVHDSTENASSAQNAVELITVNNIKIALLAFTYGINGNPIPKDNPFAVELLCNKNRLIEALRYARAEADCVIVFVHWGEEYSSKRDENQEYYTNLFMEEGVDAVIGTHPHVIQNMEMVAANGRTMPVYYSLGNLISNQDKEECLVGGAAEFDIIKLPDKKAVIAGCCQKSVKTVGDIVVWDN